MVSQTTLRILQRHHQCLGVPCALPDLPTGINLLFDAIQAQQRPFLLRAIYFLLIGWWFSGVWMAVAYVALLTIVGFPLAFWMYGRVGAVTTLYRS